MAFEHTDQSDQVIRSGYATSVPVYRIAEALGVTRNVIIGRARKLGLSYDPIAARRNNSDRQRGVPRPYVSAYFAERRRAKNVNDDYTKNKLQEV